MDWTEIIITVSSRDLERAAAIAQVLVPGVYIEDYTILEQEAGEIAGVDLIDEELLRKDRKIIISRGIPIIILLSMPCLLGFNVLSGIQPLGEGSCILDLEDFLVSNNLLPIGSVIYLLFCTSRYGWGWDNFIREADTGKGIAFPKWLRFYVSYVLPLIVLAIFVQGYYAKFFQ